MIINWLRSNDSAKTSEHKIIISISVFISFKLIVDCAILRHPIFYASHSSFFNLYKCNLKEEMP